MPARSMICDEEGRAVAETAPFATATKSRNGSSSSASLGLEGTMATQGLGSLATMALRLLTSLRRARICSDPLSFPAAGTAFSMLARAFLRKSLQLFDVRFRLALRAGGGNDISPPSTCSLPFPGLLLRLDEDRLGMFVGMILASREETARPR